MKDKCDILQLRNDFPQKNFEPWTSEGEALLSKHGCDIVSIPSKNGIPEHLVGNKINSSLFLASGYIQSVRKYDDDKEQWVGELGKLTAFRKDKIVITGQNGSGTILSKDDAGKIIKNVQKLVEID